MKNLFVDLKICEGCGALWLRTVPGQVYCRRCAPLLADFPAARGTRRKKRAAAQRPSLLRRSAQPGGGAQ
jgi:hypothetical protein